MQRTHSLLKGSEDWSTLINFPFFSLGPSWPCNYVMLVGPGSSQQCFWGQSSTRLPIWQQSDPTFLSSWVQVTCRFLVFVLCSLDLELLAWANIFLFCFVLSLVFWFLLYFGFMGPCLVLDKERKSESVNTFGAQTFILFLMAQSENPCNCCNQVAD